MIASGRDLPGVLDGIRLALMIAQAGPDFGKDDGTGRDAVGLEGPEPRPTGDAGVVEHAVDAGKTQESLRADAAHAGEFVGGLR